MKKLRLAVLALALVSGGATALTNDIVGRASVIDADTLDIHGQRVRFHGVDAMESSQLCQDASGRDYRCGQKAALALADKIGQATVTCERKDVDRYNRVVAVCRASGVDLNGWLVEQGLALAYRQYSKDYVAAEERARAANRGVWAGSFTPPGDYRKAKRDGGGSDLITSRAPAAAPAAPVAQAASGSTGGCLIKGNISAKGERIYHTPASNMYARTQIDTSQGERMFCSEDEARAAGWRAPLN